MVSLLTVYQEMAVRFRLLAVVSCGEMVSSLAVNQGVQVRFLAGELQRYVLMAMILGFHPGDAGSIPATVYTPMRVQRTSNMV